MMVMAIFTNYLLPFGLKTIPMQLYEILFSVTMLGSFLHSTGYHGNDGHFENFKP
jgi:hypothetical protein